MYIKPATLAAVVICLASAPAFAKAVTYTGTLDGQAIVLELTDFKDGPLLGRYSYQSNGADGLDVSFAQNDVAVFLIGDIEDAGCMGTVVSVPLADIKDLLTDKAVDYFPSLKS